MDISFLTMLPQFQQLSEEKKQFLIEFAMADHGNNANSAAQSLMQAIQTAKGKHFLFQRRKLSFDRSVKAEYVKGRSHAHRQNVKNGAAVPNDAADEETLTEKEL